MTATPHTADATESEQLAARVRRLTAENAILRDNQSPAAGPVELQAENVILRREAEMLRRTLPEFTAHEGPLPETLAGFHALPAAHRRQLLRDRPDHVRKLRDLAALLREADRRASRQAERQAALDGADVGALADLSALPADERRQAVLNMTPQQRRALLGLPAGPDERPGGGYL